MRSARSKHSKTPGVSSRPRGQIIPKGDRKYLVRVFTGREPNTGKRLYAAETVIGTHGQAVKALTRKLSEVDQGTYRAPVRQTLGAFLRDAWLKERETDVKAGSLSPRSLEDYRRSVDKLVSHLGGTQLDAITKGDVAALRVTLKATYKPSAAQRAFDVFRMAMKRAFTLDKIAVNPAPAEKRIATPKPRTAVLTVEEAARFLASAVTFKGGRFSAVFHVLLQGGLRPQEALALRWSDLQDGALRIERAVTRDMNRKPVIGPTKTRETRHVGLPDAALQAIEGHRMAQRADVLRSGVRATWDDAGRLMFPDDRGELLGIDSLRRAWKAISKDAKVPTVRLYDARHSYVTALFTQGVDPRTVADLAGHADPAMTLRRYAHALPSAKLGAVEKLQAAFSAASAIRQTA